jgi:hypothetical protein
MGARSARGRNAGDKIVGSIRAGKKTTSNDGRGESRVRHVSASSDHCEGDVNDASLGACKVSGCLHNRAFHCRARSVLAVHCDNRRLGLGARKRRTWPTDRVANISRVPLFDVLIRGSARVALREMEGSCLEPGNSISSVGAFTTPQKTTFASAAPKERHHIGVLADPMPNSGR